MRHMILRRTTFLCVCRRYATGAKPTKKRSTRPDAESMSAAKEPKERKNASKNSPKDSSGTKRPNDGKTTLEVGTAFEMRSLKLLRDNFSMTLDRVAGPGDGGVDLVGWWWLPKLSSLPSYSAPIIESSGTDRTLSNATTDEIDIKKTPLSRIRVLAQCKAEKMKIGPNYVRELEGVLHRVLQAPTATQSETFSEVGSQMDSGRPLRVVPTLAMLISQSPFTNGAILRGLSSSIPFIFLHLPPQHDLDPSKVDDNDQEVSSPSLQWNPAVEKGLLGGNLEVRWERKDGYGRPILYWQGSPMPACIPD